MGIGIGRGIFYYGQYDINNSRPKQNKLRRITTHSENAREKCNVSQIS